jgi:hypothetical protein
MLRILLSSAFLVLLFLAIGHARLTSSTQLKAPAQTTLHSAQISETLNRAPTCGEPGTYCTSDFQCCSGHCERGAPVCQ